MPIFSLLLTAGMLCAMVFFFSPGFLRRPISPARRWLIGMLQAIPLALIIWLLANPSWTNRQTETIEKIHVGILDDSPSMSFGDGISSSNRLAAASAWISQTSNHETLGKIQWMRLSSLLAGADSASDFGAAFEELKRVIPKENIESVAFLSDGISHGARDAAQAAEELGAPFHTIGIGPQVADNSIKVAWVDVPSRVAPGASVLLNWTLDAKQKEPKSVKAVIQSGSQEVGTLEAQLTPPSTHLAEQVSLSFKETGRHDVVLTILSTRTSQIVARATAELRVEQSTPTILILEGSPGQLSQSFAQSALKWGNYRVRRPVSLPEGGGVIWDVFHTPSEKTPWESESNHRVDAKAWENEIHNALKEVNLIVLGQRPFENFPSSWFAAVDERISSRRCGLLALPGSASGMESLPEGRIRQLLMWASALGESPTPTYLSCPEENRTHPALAPVWSHLLAPREIGGDLCFESIPRFARSLLSNQSGKSLLFEVPFGLSRAAVMAPSSLWKLRSFDDSSKGRPASFLDGLWIGLADYLTRDSTGSRKQARITPNPAGAGQEVTIQVEDPAILPEMPSPNLRVRLAGGDWRSLLLAPDKTAPGTAKATWFPKEAGDYEIQYASGEEIYRSRILAQPPENEDRLLNEAALKNISERTRGKYIDFVNRDDLAALMTDGERTWTRIAHHPMRHDLWMGILIIVLLCLGWGIRRMASLP